MRIRRRIKRLARRLTGTPPPRTLPRGVDFARDMACALPRYRATVVFDVGANVGQSARLFLSKLPESHIYCFEPVSAAYRELRHAYEGNPRVECFQLAFGSAKNTGEMVLQGPSYMSYLRDQSQESPQGEAPTEPVSIDTVDAFCAARGIAHVSYLKIDTEGGDLDVLRGAASMLSGQRIDVVQVEAGMNPGNSRHVPFESLKSFLESHGYYLFGLYEQVNEWPTGEPHLRRTNPLFISRRTIEENRTAEGVGE